MDDEIREDGGEYQPSEMTEQHDSIMVRPLRTVITSFASVSMPCQQLVELFSHIAICLSYVAF